MDTASWGTPCSFDNCSSPEVESGAGNSALARPLTLSPLSIDTIILSVGYNCIICCNIFLICAEHPHSQEICSGPVGPVFPVAPVGPVAPSAPVGPVAPINPVAPVIPVGPVLPVGQCICAKLHIKQ